jgi:hypothetical protein
MYRNQMDSMGYNRGSSNMLGLVLIFVAIAIVLTVLAVLGVTDAFQDAARARQIDSQTEHQEALWEADQPNLALKAASQAALEADNARAAGMRAVADAQAYADSKAESMRLAKGRNDQRLAREKMLGEAAVYLTALTMAVIVLLMGFTSVRLIDRLLPRQQPTGLNEPVASRPRPRPATQPAQLVAVENAPRIPRTTGGPQTNTPIGKRISGWTPRTH